MSACKLVRPASNVIKLKNKSAREVISNKGQLSNVCHFSSVVFREIFKNQ